MSVWCIWQQTHCPATLLMSLMSHGQYCIWYYVLCNSTVLSVVCSPVCICHKGSASPHIQFLSCTITVHSLPICCSYSVMTRTTRAARAAIALTITTVFVSHTRCLWYMPKACSKRTNQLNAVSAHAAAFCISGHISHLSTFPCYFFFPAW